MSKNRSEELSQHGKDKRRKESYTNPIIVYLKNTTNTSVKIPSTASRKFRRSLETGRRSFEGPVKSSVGCVVVVGNKGQDAGAQLLHGEATESGKQATNENREPALTRVERPGCVGAARPSACAGW